MPVIFYPHFLFSNSLNKEVVPYWDRDEVSFLQESEHIFYICCTTINLKPLDFPKLLIHFEFLVYFAPTNNTKEPPITTI